MKRLSLDQFVRRMDHVVWKVIDGKGVLLNLEDGAYFEVDPVGLAIWQQFGGDVTLAEIVQSIGKKFRADLKRVTRDMMAFVSELKRRKIVEVSEMPVSLSVSLN